MPRGKCAAKGEFWRGSYGGKGGQITWQAGVPPIGGNRGAGGNISNRGGY